SRYALSPCLATPPGVWDKHLLESRPSTRTCRARDEVKWPVFRGRYDGSPRARERSVKPFHNLNVRKRGGIMQGQLPIFLWRMTAGKHVNFGSPPHRPDFLPTLILKADVSSGA